MMPTLRTETSGLSCSLQRLIPLRVVEIEEAHGVGAGVGAITRADAAVVDLGVQAFVGVIAGVGGADGLARGVIALLAQNGLKANFAGWGTRLPSSARRESSAWRGRAPPDLRRRWRYCFPRGRRPRTPRSPCSGRDQPPFPIYEPCALSISLLTCGSRNIYLPPLFFVRETAHSSREQH